MFSVHIQHTELGREEASREPAVSQPNNDIPGIPFICVCVLHNQFAVNKSTRSAFAAPVEFRTYVRTALVYVAPPSPPPVDRPNRRAVRRAACEKKIINKTKRTPIHIHAYTDGAAEGRRNLDSVLST